MAKYAMNNAGTFNVRGQLVEDENGKRRVVVNQEDVDAAILGKAAVTEKDDLRVVLEDEKVDGGLPNETYYLYGVGGYWLEFTQDRENGNIHRAYVWEKGTNSTKSDSGIRFLVDSERNVDRGYYPNVFRVDLAFHYMSAHMSVEDAKVFAGKLVEATVVMDKVREFFENSKHRELYCAKHNKGVEGILQDASDRSKAQYNSSEEIGMRNEELRSCIGPSDCKSF